MRHECCINTYMEVRTMELYDLISPVENMLAANADMLRMPLGGTMELLPLCNMNCKMCYIRQTRDQMEARGRMLSCDRWLKIARDAKDNGVLFLLITGGEPLVYPEFQRLYTELMHMGFVITINTNGTLIDEKWADIFGKYPCRRLNITLYGADDTTYERLCGNPKGFSQVMDAVKLLNDRKVPFRFNYSITPDNINQLPQIHEVAEQCHAHLEACSYMFPPARKEGYDNEFCRLSPEEAAESLFSAFRGRNPQGDLSIASKNTLEKLKHPVHLSSAKGLTCRAGRSGFWMNWKGELLPCGMFHEPRISLLEHSFKDCWEHIVKETSELLKCGECESCDKKRICKTCAAACLTETGKIDGKPEYLCKMTEAYYKLLKSYCKS
ncbi:radical SAM/SPASM domain-containing protein [Alloiococcus sp. CFN-8]|uniref:radical SAM protein n=1 Tax=Alloiococcus sp. CFN-8 TaxID=3416081 RepID=UPI003CEDFDFC